MSVDTGIGASVFSDSSMDRYRDLKQHPDLRLVLLGSQKYGADAVANTILGGDVFNWGRRTANSVTHMGRVNGKTVQLVKAPLWLRGYHLCDTAQILKEELVLTVTRCHPGPHAFILLVEVDLPFTSACARAVEEHLQLFGESVWSHTIVLFTCVDWLGSATIRQYIDGEGDDLKQLLKRCGNRYFKIDSTKRDYILSQELLEKIEKMVKHNNGRHFEIEENVLQEIKERREEVTKRAENRRTKNKIETDKAGAPLSELTIILLGWVFARKSVVANALLGTHEAARKTDKCVKGTRVLGDLTVTVVSTPGWWKFFPANLVPNAIRSEIMKALDLDQPNTHPSVKDHSEDQESPSRVVLLMVSVETSFTDEQRKIIEDNMRPLGQQVWENTIVVFTTGQWLGEFSIEQHIESEGDALIWLVEKCGNRYLVFDDEKVHDDGDDTLIKELLDKIQEILKRTRFRGQSPQTFSTAETEDHTEAAGEDEVDEDLKKMVDVLHRVWEWGSWEIEEVQRRFNKRPKRVIQRGSMDHPLCLGKDTWSENSWSENNGSKSIPWKMYHNREEMEKVLREETCGKSLEEVMEIALKIYFRQECGAFDIVSILTEKDTFKPEWKQLFVREWSRREERLMEYVAQRSWNKSDDDPAEPDPKKMMEVIKKVSAWLESQEGVTEAINVG